jgi:hypothetical protein
MDPHLELVKWMIGTQVAGVGTIMGILFFALRGKADSSTLNSFMQTCNDTMKSLGAEGI